jgi:monoamine oxidase
MYTIHVLALPLQAMPPHLTGRIRYDPPMPPARDQLTQRVFMGSIIKCIAVYEDPWWRADPATNMSFAFDPASHGAMRVAFDITPPGI